MIKNRILLNLVILTNLTYTNLAYSNEENVEEKAIDIKIEKKSNTEPVKKETVENKKTEIKTESTSDDKFDEMLHQLALINDSVRTIKFSKDNKFIYAGKFSGDLEVFSINREKITRIKTLRNHSGSTGEIQISNNNKYLVSTGDDAKVNILELSSLNKISTIKSDSEYSTGVQISPDNKKIFSIGNDGFLKVWDFATNSKLKEIKLKPKLVKVSPKGNYIFISDDSGNISILDANSLKILKTIKGNDNLNIYGKISNSKIVIVNRAGIFTHNNEHLAFQNKGSLFLYDIKSDKIIKEIKNTPITENMEFDQKDKYLMLDHVDKVTVIDIESGKIIREVKIKEDSSLAASISPDGKILAVGWVDAGIQFYKLKQ